MKEKPYMLIGDTIGRFTQIESSEGPSSRPYAGHILVRDLASITDKSTSDRIKVDGLLYTRIYSLLRVLHRGGLYGDYTWCLQRLRNSNDSNGSLLPGFEEGEVGQIRKESVTRDEEISKGKFLVESLGPFSLYPLEVSLKFVSGGTGTMFGNKSPIVDIFIYALEDITPKKRPHALESLDTICIEGSVRGSHFLLTLDVPLYRRRYPSF
jgi:hypothetical protein